MIAKQLKITGMVQGVGFRDWLVLTAGRLGLSGWVRNRLDGSVEALIAGEENAVEDCIRACRRGPRLASVDQMEEGVADPPENHRFIMRPTV
jgi:acylphosphatase